MSLIGEVMKMDVDATGKASRARARVAIELDKPLRQGVLLHMSRNEEPKWFQAQYEEALVLCRGCC
jgi:hypothetical protein